MLQPKIHIILVSGANQGTRDLHYHGSNSLIWCPTPKVLVFMDDSRHKRKMSILNWSQRCKGSRKITAAEEALAGFASDIHPASTVVPVQLDITEDKSITEAHVTIANYLNAKGLRGPAAP
ncbi:hypothetical protein B0H13DRAFT_2358916 [Mycena leptocephala]|nr:hypothetical protein B0H13DRAFT_2358916 [Mycena leptocephala]